MRNLLALTRKSIIASSISLAIISFAHQNQAATLSISQQPLFLTQSVAANILVTLDDSGSMAWAYAPDSMLASRTTNRFKSSTFNPIYFNPNIAYELPKLVTLSGGIATITTVTAPSFTAAPLNGFTGTGSINLSTNFAPTTEYSAATGHTTTGTARSAYYYEHTGGSIDSDASYVLRTVSAAQQANFAIWYSFYRTRALATQSAANLAFASLPENIRLSWQQLNNGNCNTVGAGSNSGSCSTNFLRPFTASHKVNFYNWLTNFQVTGGTPLLRAMQRAGSFLGNTTNNGPYAENLGSSVGTEYACRKTFHILMTDGKWNSFNTSDGFNRDSTTTTLPVGATLGAHTYNSATPYRDTASNTLADSAFRYWATDARTDIANRIKPLMPFAANPLTPTTAEYLDPRNNPAEWQNMVTYTIGLGLESLLTIPNWDGSTYAGTGYAGLLNGTIAWPPAADDNNNNAYDLWHAAINSRGQFFSADTPKSVSDAFQSILNTIGDSVTAASKPSFSSSLQDGGEGSDTLLRYAYQSSFDSSKAWQGDLSRIKLVTTTTAGHDTLTKTIEWKAQAILDARNIGTDSRNILIAKPTTPVSLQSFTWGNLSTAQQTLLNRNPDSSNAPDTRGPQRVDFLRGTRDLETTIFRTRTSRLGDIIGSSPAVVGKAKYLAYLANPIEPTATSPNTYSDFKAAQLTRRAQVYVGGNDGMLHGFDAATGIEKFAFIPQAVFNNLNSLTGKSYQAGAHKFYVDGSPVVADAYFADKWHTVLIGTLRAGGQGLFALDVTDPDNIKLLWEFGTTQDTDLGFTFAKPTVARLHSGQWAVVTGNGPNSLNDKAALLIIDLEKGTLIKKLIANGTPGIANGLSTPKLADNNGDGVADYAYAGDLQGNMWRFDLIRGNRQYDPALPGYDPFTRSDDSASASAEFKVSFTNTPLYSAKATEDNSRQPITAAPSIIRHPTRLGYLIIFGTGKYFEPSDANANTARSQTLYGIWDRQTKGEPAISTPALTSRSQLLKQNFLQQTSGLFGTITKEVRIVSNNAATWYAVNSSVNQYGWYLDFTVPTTRLGELLIDDMYAAGQSIFLQTLTPNSDPCGDGATAWTYGLDPFTGGRTKFTILDLAQVGTPDPTSNLPVPGSDSLVVSGSKQDGLGGLAISRNEKDQVQVCTSDDCTNVTFGPNSNGRQTWRTIEVYP